MIEDWWRALISSGVVVSILAFFGIRQINRLDKVETGKASKQELEATATRLLAMCEKTDVTITKVDTKLDQHMRDQTQVNLKIVQSLGRLEQKS